MIAPKASSKARISSTGSDEPPDTHSRSVERSALSRVSQCSIALYIVGTPMKTVTSSRSMISSALAGSKRGISVTVAPLAIAAFIVQVWPKEWNSGSAPSSTSSGDEAAEDLRRGLAVAREVGVRELGALGRAGRARGVEDHRGVVAGAVGELAHRLGRGEQLLELAGDDDDRLGAGLAGPCSAGSAKSRQPNMILAPESSR